MATTSGRVPACGSGRGAGTSGAACCTEGVAAGGGAGIVATAGLAGTPCVGVAAVAKAAMGSAAGVPVDGDGPAVTGFSVVATAGVAAAVAGTDAGAASPGHSSTSTVPDAPVSRGVGIALTLPARSNTTRTVPGTGCPVRTALTMPAAAGSARPRARWLAGKSTASRSGLESGISRYSPALSRWSSARVPVAPVSMRNCLISEAFTWKQAEATSSMAAGKTRLQRFPIGRMAGS